MKNLKIFCTFSLAAFLTVSASAQQLVGAINMLSNRVIHFSKNYELLQKNITLDDYVLQNFAATTIQEAIDKTVLSVPCGEFIMNAQIYMVDNMFVVVGDVWGEKHNTCLYQVGDLVTFGKKKVGEIVSIKDDDDCMVKDLKNGKVKEMDFDDLTHAKADANQTSFNVGDKVTWKVFGGVTYKTGVIISIKDKSTCLVQDDQSGNTKEMYFQNLYKLGE